MVTQEELIRVCDPQMLSLALDLSRLAYHDDVIGQYEDIYKFESWYSSATGYLLRTDEYDCLTFRGSQQPMDWLINAMVIPPVYYKGSWCHAGFAFSHQSIWRKIRKEINPEHPLLVTGHSLGGGNADKSCDFLTEHNSDVHMITFGKPNVHLKGSQPDRGFLSTHLSVVSGSDLVTRIPKILYGAHALQDMLYLANTGEDFIDPSKEFVREDFSRADMITDHSIDGVYEPRVEALINSF